MSFTEQDYQHTLEHFIDDLSPIAEYVESIVLYGSMAKGTLRPGKSDVLDAILYLDGSFTEDRERYLALIELMVTACEHIRDSGLPFKHPFHWYFTDEIEETAVQEFLEMEDDKATRIVFGNDIRQSIQSSHAGRVIYKKYALLFLRHFQSELCSMAAMDTLGDHFQRILKYLITFHSKGLPPVICAAYDIQVPSHEAIDALTHAFPDIHMTILREMDVDAIFADADVEKRCHDFISELLTFTEIMQRKILEHMQQQASEA